MGHALIYTGSKSNIAGDNVLDLLWRKFGAPNRNCKLAFMAFTTFIAANHAAKVMSKRDLEELCRKEKRN